MQSVGLVVAGLVIGVAASFSGLGGGFLMIPLLLFLGFTAQQAAGTAFMAILILSISALVAFGRMGQVDYRVGILLGVGALLGAQLGPRLLQHVSVPDFKRLFSVVLMLLGVVMWVKK